MRNNNSDIIEEEEKTEEAVSGNNHVSKKDCITISGLFEICVGRAYSFLIGRRTIIGIVDEINPRYYKARVTTERGTVVIDLRKASVIEEVR